MQVYMLLKFHEPSKAKQDATRTRKALSLYMVNSAKKLPLKGEVSGKLLSPVYRCAIIVEYTTLFAYNQGERAEVQKALNNFEPDSYF
jgi:hypothetical protein